MSILIQVVSLVGAGLILLAYFRSQRGFWAQHDRAYLWCNLMGATLLTVVAVWDRRIGFIVLEAAWVWVSLASLRRTISRATP